MQIPDHALMADVLMKSFEKWGKKDKKWAKHYKKLSDVAFEIVHDGFSEIRVHKPFQFDVWWMNNHMRYYQRYRGEEMRMLYQMVYNFLSAYAHGRLDVKGPGEKDGKAKAS